MLSKRVYYDSPGFELFLDVHVLVFRNIWGVYDYYSIDSLGGCPTQRMVQAMSGFDAVLGNVTMNVYSSYQLAEVSAPFIGAFLFVLVTLPWEICKHRGWFRR
jgi:hypothetical protein